MYLDGHRRDDAMNTFVHGQALMHEKKYPFGPFHERKNIIIMNSGQCVNPE